MPACLFYGMNPQWIQSRTQYLFKCPLCGETYRAGSTLEQVVPVQFCIEIYDPVTNKPAQIPCAWPPEQGMDWLTKMITLHTRQITSVEDAAAWHERSKVDLHDLLARIALPAGFQKLRLQCPPERAPATDWDWKQLAKDGVIGGRLTMDQVEKASDSWPELISLVANNLCARRALQGLA